MKKLLLLLPVTVAACTFSLNKNVETAMRQYDNLLLHTDAKAIAEMFTINGEMAPKGAPPIVGRDNIEQFLLQFKGVKVEEQKSTTDSIRRIADTAFQYGKYYQRAIVKNDTFQIHGMYQANWLIQPNGKLLLKRMSAWSTGNN